MYSRICWFKSDRQNDYTYTPKFYLFGVRIYDLWITKTTFYTPATLVVATEPSGIFLPSILCLLDTHLNH